MWVELKPLTKGEMSELRGHRRAKLYADENIEDEVVEVFKDNGVNITSARELGFSGRPDSFHAAHAFKEKRFLLTKNAKHFLDDRAVPFNRTHGIIAIQGDMNEFVPYIRAILQVFNIIPYGEIWERSKMRITSNDLSVRFISGEGQMVRKRFRTESGKLFEWIE